MRKRLHLIAALVVGILLIGGCVPYTPHLVRGMDTDQCNREMLKSVPFAALVAMRVCPDGSMVETWSRHDINGGYWYTEIHKDPDGNVRYWKYYGI